jgi:hypothetical protein
MFPRITQVRHIRDYILEFTFADGVRTELDFRARIVWRGGVLFHCSKSIFSLKSVLTPNWARWHGPTRLI